MNYFIAASNGKIECSLCHHHCKLQDNIIGFCGAQKNVEGKLKNITYGYPEALNIDPVEKKPLYHFLPNSKTLSLGTIGCNFRCPFCQNYSLSQKRDIDTRNYFSCEKIVDLALENDCKSISYTYNEPVVFYQYARDIGMLAKKRGLKNIFVTSGYESFEVCEDMSEWVDACNVDLKSFNKEYYKKVLKTDLAKVLQSLELLVKKGIFVEVTTLLIPGVNDSLAEIREMGKFIYNSLGANTPWHLSAFHPAYKQQKTQKTPPETLIMAREIGVDIGLNYVYTGNISKDFPTLCPSCKKALLSRDYFQTNNLGLDSGKCRYCGTDIVGVWK